MTERITRTFQHRDRAWEFLTVTLEEDDRYEHPSQDESRTLDEWEALGWKLLSKPGVLTDEEAAARELEEHNALRGIWPLDTPRS